MKFVKPLLVSALLALPVPLVLPYLLNAVAQDNAFSAVLNQDYAVSYYLITWVLVTVASLIACLASGGSAQGANAVAKGSQHNARKAVKTEGRAGKDQGVVKWFNVNKGFGFITTESGEDIFVHFRSIQGKGRRSLRQGQKVRFDISEGDKGSQADNVSVVQD